MNSNTKQLIAQIEAAINDMRYQDAIIALANAMSHANAVAFYAELQQVQTPVAQADICLRYCELAVC
jgi:hypothetical protein